MLGHLSEISVVDFDHRDVVRHPLVSKIVKAYSDKSTGDDKGKCNIWLFKLEKFIKKPGIYLNKIKILSKAPFFKSKNHEFSVLLTNNKNIKKLNFKFEKNKPTDVLSFPIEIK